jgi:hypothetical protein
MSDEVAKKERSKIVTQPKELMDARKFAQNVVDY